MSVRDIVQAAAGVSTGNPNAWDISYAFYDGPNLGDVSTAIYQTSADLSAQQSGGSGGPEGVAFKVDGSKFYMIGRGTDTVFQYSTGSAWNISGFSYDSKSFSVASQETQPTGVSFKSDGTKMYVIGYTNDTVYQYSLSTAWDVSTASYDSVSFSVASQETVPQGLTFKPDGTKMYIVGSTGDDVNEYNLSTAWDVSSASYVQNFSVATQELVPTGIAFLSDGTKMYVTGYNSNGIYEYSLSTPWDISTSSYVQTFSPSAQTVAPIDLAIKPDGSFFYLLSYANNLGTAENKLYQYVIGGFSVAAQDTQPRGLFFKPDGTKFYYAGDGGNAIDEFSLSTAWDLSSASFVQTFSVSARDTIPNDVFFKDDGTVMFFAGDANNKIYQYSLSVAWDISTASFVNDYAVDVAGTPTSPQGMFWRPDGTRMFICVSSDVYQFNMTFGSWNVANLNYSGTSKSLAAQGISDARSLFFQSDGLTMYVLDKTTLKVFQYSLSTAWDVSSASSVSSSAVGNEGIQPWGLFWRDDGTEFYVTNYTIDKVLNYKISPE